MPQIEPSPDLLTPAAVHAVWTLTDDGIRTACGMRLERADTVPCKATTQSDQVTCDECIRTLRAAGLAAWA